MNPEPLDDRLERLSRGPVPDPCPAFNAAVWQRIDGSREARRGWLADVVPALGWRAVPAGLALAVGMLAGTALVGERERGALDAFDPQSAYSLVALVGTGTGARR